MNARNWFIDYIQLFVGTSELYRNKVNPKRLTKALQEIDTQIKKWLIGYGLEKKITHISTAGGALVRYLTGIKLPMIKSLEESAEKYRSTVKNHN